MVSKRICILLGISFLKFVNCKLSFSIFLQGARDYRLGGCGSFINLTKDDMNKYQKGNTEVNVNLIPHEHPFHANMEVIGGVLEEDSSMLMKRFFSSVRNKGDLDGTHC